MANVAQVVHIGLPDAVRTALDQQDAQLGCHGVLQPAEGAFEAVVEEAKVEEARWKVEGGRTWASLARGRTG